METQTELPEGQSPSPMGEHIAVRAGYCGGKPHIVGHRIKVQHVAVWHERMGLSPDEIASEYGLTLGEVYAALSYYWDHRDQIEADIEEGRALAARLRGGAPSIFDKVRQADAPNDSLPPG